MASQVTVLKGKNKRKKIYMKFIDKKVIELYKNIEEIKIFLFT